jgi:hypothetical protein
MELSTTHKKLFSAFLFVLAGIAFFMASPRIYAQASSTPSPLPDPNQTAQEKPVPTATKPAPEPGDPNEAQSLPQKEEEIDPFNLKASSLVLIQEAYEKIFTPELISDDGRVAYATLRRKRTDMMTSMRELETLNPAVLMSLSKEERIAFWINTYNVCMIKLIIDRYPIEPKWYMILYPDNSIMQIPNAWTNVYFNIQKLEYNLKEIEQNFLLERYKDPRICFAISYASVGGANIRKEPYRGGDLETQLNDQVKQYLKSEKGLKLDKANNVLYLSNLFQMHKKTFIESEFASILKFRNRKVEERAWLNFILPYLDETDVYYLEKNNVEIKFIQYDWHLNEIR